MKITFDSEEQKDNFAKHITSAFCPSLFGLKGSCCDFEECDDCWKHSGIELEVRDENQKN